jgi:hypothetical protein
LATNGHKAAGEKMKISSGMKQKRAQIEVCSVVSRTQSSLETEKVESKHASLKLRQNFKTTANRFASRHPFRPTKKPVFSNPDAPFRNDNAWMAVAVHPHPRLFF